MDGRFRDQLRRQLRYIENSCQAYDQGDIDEGIRIATSLRVILHNTKVEFYNRGGIRNPWQTPRLRRPLDLTSEELEALVPFLQTLTGEGPRDPGRNCFRNNRAGVESSKFKVAVRQANFRTANLL